MSNDKNVGFAAIPSENNRLPVRVASTLVDNFAGTSITEIVWGSTPNLKYVNDCFSADEKATRKATSLFFVSRAIGPVMRNMIQSSFFRPAETAFTKEEYFSALSKTVKNRNACGVIMELTLPSLVGIGLISGSIDYSRQIEYGFKSVTLQAIKNDVMVFQATEAAKAGKLSMSGKDRISKSVFAELVAEAFYDVGIAIEGMTDMSDIVDDMVLGVRAHIDYTFTIDPKAASVPIEWRTHRIIAELATNLVFVRAALQLPADGKARLKCDSSKLEKYAPVVMSALKSSDRYAWVSKEVALSTFEIAKVRNIEGRPVCAVIGRNVEVMPVGQAVMAIEDVSMKEAVSVTATKDRIAESIQVAYGKARFNLVEGAQMLADNIREYVDAGWVGSKRTYMVDTRTGMTVHDIAALLAETLYVTIEGGKVKVDAIVRSKAEVDKAGGRSSESDIDEGDVEWNPEWWYEVATSEKSLRVWFGTHLGDRVITSSADEVVLAGPEREARGMVPARQQLLSPQAFNTRLISFDEERLISVEKRFSFNVAIGGISMQGAFKATDFASLRSSEYTSMTKPFFNEEVISGLQAAYTHCKNIDNVIDAASEDDWEHGVIDSSLAKHIRNRYARTLLRTAQQLDPAFRHEVQQVMIERAVQRGEFKGSQADLYRSKLGQRSFMAYVDVVALLFFLHVQGIDAEVWREIAISPEMARMCMDFGSDRHI